MVGRICRIKYFYLGGKHFADEEVETEMRKWLNQQSKNFYAAGFDALGKRWDKCINVGGGYVEKSMFFPRFKYRMFYVVYSFVICLLTLPRISMSDAFKATQCLIQGNVY
jgi:hypothetical protein